MVVIESRHTIWNTKMGMGKVIAKVVWESKTLDGWYSAIEHKGKVFHNCNLVIKCQQAHPYLKGCDREDKSDFWPASSGGTCREN